MRTATLTLTALLLTLPHMAAAQWSTTPYGAMEVYNGPALYCTFYFDPVQLGSGDFIATYLPYVYPLDEPYVNYLQRLTLEGEKLWGEYGIPVCAPADSDQTNGPIKSDGQGGAFVVWWDSRGDEPEWEIYGQHISADGEFLWDPAGLLLITPNEYISNMNIDICEDGEGGAYITWCQMESQYTQDDIYAQRINSEGQLMWPESTPVCVATGASQNSQKIILREGGGCIIVWADDRFSDFNGAAGQRLDPFGNALWQQDGVYFNVSTIYMHSIMSDGLGGFLFRNSAQVMRVDENANVLWTQPVNTSGYSKSTRDFDMTPDGRIYVPFGVEHNTWPPEDRNLYGQCFDLDGHYLWDPEGIPLVEAIDDQDAAYLALTDNGFITAYHDERYWQTSSDDVYYVVVDSSGQVISCFDGRPLYISNLSEATKSVISDGQGGALVVWAIYDGIYGVIANRILSNGNLGYADPPDISISLMPYGQPIQIPANGGQFEFNIAAANDDSVTHLLTVWCDVTLPNGSTYGPVLGPVDLSLDSGASLDRDRIQAVPENAPAGQYIYNAYVGIYPSPSWSVDTFLFEKLSTGDGLTVTEWSNDGRSFDAGVTVSTKSSEDFITCNVFPNPFNPATTFSFVVPEAAEINLTVYDITGRTVAALIDGWRDAGVHEVTFDGSDLASGLYIYQLRAGEFTATGKMMLVK